MARKLCFLLSPQRKAVFAGWRNGLDFLKGKCDHNPRKDDGDTLPRRSLFGAREGSSRGQRVTQKGESQGLLCMKTTAGGMVWTEELSRKS